MSQIPTLHDDVYVKYSCGCQHHPELSEELRDGRPIVHFLIPLLCPECENGDYYKLYIGPNRFLLGESGVFGPGGPEGEQVMAIWMNKSNFLFAVNGNPLLR